MNLERLLRQRVLIESALVAVDGNLGVRSPSYGPSEGTLPGLVQPARGSLQDSAGGDLPEATHVAYVEAGVAVEPGDGLALVVAETTVLVQAEIGETSIRAAEVAGLEAGMALRIGQEAARIESMEADEIGLREPLQERHEAGESVWAVRLHEVQAVMDEGGQGHHLRLALREVGV